MKFTPVLAILVIAAPCALAVFDIEIFADVPTLSIFGVNGDRASLRFRSTESREFLLVATSREMEGTTNALPALEPGNASFGHESDGMKVNCRIEGFSPKVTPPGDRPGAFVWTLAGLADKEAKPCEEQDGLRLVCLEPMKDGKPVADVKQLCR